MNTPDVARSDPVPIAPETWLVPNLVPAGPDAYLHRVSAMIVAKGVGWLC